MPDEIFCENCGAPNRPQAQFCESCGRSLQARSAPATPSYSNNYIPQTEKMDYPPDYSSYQASSPQVAPAWQSAPAQQTAKRSVSKWIFIGAGLALLACCAVAAVVAIALNYLGGDEETPISILSTETSTPVPTSTAVPTSPPYKSPTPSLTGQQRLGETDFFDDFSSNTLKWYVGDDDQSGTGYENETYFIEVKVPDYRQLVQPPVHDLTHLEYDAEGVQGAGNGTFGVACYYNDLNNYHSVDFDSENQRMIFGEFENGKYKPLSDWKSFSGSQGPLHIAVDCTPGLISAYVNNALVSELQVSQPVEPAQMWISTMSYSDAPGGLKVIFDDVQGYRAMQ